MEEPEGVSLYGTLYAAIWAPSEPRASLSTLLGLRPNLFLALLSPAHPFYGPRFSGADWCAVGARGFS
eukprot:7154493-Prymnesium_polylepis.1